MPDRRGAVPAAVVGAVVCLHILLVLHIGSQSLSTDSVPRRSSLFARTFHDAAATVGPGADFFALYHAGVNVRHGTSPYSPTEVPRITPYYYPYRYLPATAYTLGVLVTMLPARAAYITWMLITEVVLLFLVLALRNALGAAEWRLAVTAILLLSAPYLLELYMGQFTFVATSVACLGVLSWSAGNGGVRPWVGLTAASFLKIFPMVVLPALLRCRGGRTVVLMLLAIVVVTNVPLFLADPVSIDAFWSKNFLGEPVGLDAGNHGLLFVVFLMKGAIWGPWHLPTWGALTIVWRILVLGGTAALVLRLPGWRVETAAAALLLAHFLSYFQVWEHHMSAAIVAGLLLSVGLQRSRHTAAYYVALLATAAVALPTPFALLGPDPLAWTAVERLLPPLSKAAPVLVLYATAVWALATRHGG